MAFNAGDIVAKLRLDSKQFDATMKRIKTRTQRFGAAMKANWMKIAGGAGAATAAFFAFKKAWDLTIGAMQDGAQLKDMEFAFNRLATRAEISGTQIIDSVKDVTGALTNRQITEAANSLELLGVGMENTAQLTKIARAAGVALGKDMGYMLESIATGTARQSKLWLDNLGIIISVEDANRDYANTLGKTASALTDTEKRAAFLNAVLLKGDDIIAAVGEEYELATENINQMSAAFTNLSDTIKKDVSESSSVVKGLTAAVVELETIVAKYGTLGGLAALISPGVIGAMKVGASLRGEGPGTMTGMTTQTPGGARARTAAARRQNAATARAANMGLPGAGGPMSMGWTGAGADVRLRNEDLIDVPELANGMDVVVDGFDAAGTAAEEAGSLFQNVFADLASGSWDSGVALEKNLGRALGNLASKVGRFLVSSAQGLAAMGVMNPFAAMAAGFALQAIAGSFIGAGQGAARIPEYRTPTPRGVEVENQPRLQIHVDNMIGSKAWMNDFMREVNSVLRNDGHAEVFMT